MSPKKEAINGFIKSTLTELNERTSTPAYAGLTLNPNLEATKEKYISNDWGCQQ
jgi:hypothetical protein